MDLLTLKTWTSQEILATIEAGLEVKSHPERYKDALRGKSLAMLFQKTSTRTRCAFEVGMTQLGGHAVHLDWMSTNFVLSDLKDEAQVLSRYADGIMARMLSHDGLRDLVAGAEVPVINGCCDRYHPCQALGDLMTIRELRGRLEGAHLVYTGVLNNVCNSLIVGCTKAGVRITAVTPEANGPAEDAELVEAARASGLYEETLDLQAAAPGADFLYTDTWLDMEYFDNPVFLEEKERRLALLLPYQLNRSVLEGLDALIMHCLPAHRGYEIEGELIDDPRSVLFDQAENRLHSQKAALLKLA